MSLFLWGVLPYISFTLLIGGLVWRWRTDQYGWTSRSSQLNEGRILRAASPLFHFGILMVAGGHVMGLAIPAEVTTAMGVSEHNYHLLATVGGTLAAVMTVVGLLGLLYRRIVNKSVRLATTRNDMVMYAMLTVVIALGTIATVTTQIFGKPHGYNYRETISIWFRSVFMFQPNIDVMADVPMQYKLHIVSGLLLFAIWPFTRLVHVLSAPVGYVARPSIVYRSRAASTSTAMPRAGWAPVGKGERARSIRPDDPSSRSSRARGHGA